MNNNVQLIGHNLNFKVNMQISYVHLIQIVEVFRLT